MAREKDLNDPNWTCERNASGGYVCREDREDENCVVLNGVTYCPVGTEPPETGAEAGNTTYWLCGTDVGSERICRELDEEEIAGLAEDPDAAIWQCDFEDGVGWLCRDWDRGESDPQGGQADDVTPADTTAE